MQLFILRKGARLEGVRKARCVPRGCGRGTRYSVSPRQTGTAQVPLCDCGVHTHERGDADYMGGPFVGVFVAALDDATPEELSAARCDT